VNVAAPARRLPLELAAAAAGLVGGHIIAYQLSAPAAPIRQLLLAQTGHSYLPRAIAAAMSFAAAAAVGAAFRGAIRGWRGAVDHFSFRATFRRLAVAQTVGFVILEVMERKAAGVTLSGLVGVFPRGLAVQVAIAAFAALALWLLDRAGASIAAALHAGKRFARAVLRIRPAGNPTVGAPALVPLGSISLRGPPLSSRI
jgi:hypothetical protein